MEKLGFIKKKRTKFILAFISCIINSMGHMTVNGISGIKVYILSYIRLKEGWVDLQYGNLMSPVMSLAMALFTPLSGVLELRFGPVVSIIISAIVMEFCLFLFFLQQDIWFFYGISLLLGVGSGLSANILLKNICFYYPEKKGMINGILISIIAVISSFSSIIGEYIVNPDKISVDDAEKNPYYPEKVANRVKYYYIFAMIAFPSFILLSLIFFYRYNPNFEEEKEGEKQIENNEKSEKKEVMNEELINNKNNPPLHSFYKKPSKTKVKKVLKSFRFYRNLLIMCLLPFYLSILEYSNRVYITMIGVPQGLIFYLGTVFGLIVALFGPIWAISVDKYGFQPVVKIIGFILSGMSIYFCIFIDNWPFYLIGFIITVLALIGIMMAMTPHLMNIFGMSNFLLIAGFAGIIGQIGTFLSALTSIVLAIFFKNAFELKVPYRIVCLEGGILSFIGLVLVYFENDEKFDYGDENEGIKYFIKKGDDNTDEKETVPINKSTYSEDNN